MLKAGAILNFLLAGVHLACLFFLDAAFRFYHIDGVMDIIANDSTLLPYLLTFIIACGLAGCGIYGLSADGIIARLPMLHTITYLIGSVFLLRALIGVVGMLLLGETRGVEVTTDLIAGAIGLLYLVGGIRKFHREGKA